MKKVLFIEDRPNRQKQYFSKKINALKQISCVDIKEFNEGAEIIENINLGSSTNLEVYNLFIFHRSAFSQKGLNTLNNYCKKNNKELVFFSGGISQTTFTALPFVLLNINSKEFYTDKLLNFLEKYCNNESKHILQLYYGDNWELPLLLRYRQLIGLSDENFEKDIENIEDIIGKDNLINIDNKINKIIETI